MIYFVCVLVLLGLSVMLKGGFLFPFFHVFFFFLCIFYFNFFGICFCAIILFLSFFTLSLRSFSSCCLRVIILFQLFNS